MSTAMETAPGPKASRRAIETALIEKCWKEPDFKVAVIADPIGEFERHTGQKLPEGSRIFIHEEDAHTLHFSIPLPPPNLGELSDEELEKVAGGTDAVLFPLTITLIISLAGSISFGASYAMGGGGSTTSGRPGGGW